MNQMSDHQQTAADQPLHQATVQIRVSSTRTKQPSLTWLKKSQSGLRRTSRIITFLVLEQTHCQHDTTANSPTAGRLHY